MVYIFKLFRALYAYVLWASQGMLEVKNPPASAGHIRDAGLIYGLGRFPWRRAQQPTPVFSPMDRGAWQATVHSVTVSQIQLK